VNWVEPRELNWYYYWALCRHVY